MWKRLPIPLLVAAITLLVLPSVLLALGLTMTSASEVVIYAIACMALNILVGHTGPVSFGHGAWFWPCCLRRRADATQCDARFLLRPDNRRCVDRSHDRRRLRLPDPAAARCVFLATDAGAFGDALRGLVSLDRSHWRRKRIGRY